jgi:hypothetical protein
MSIVTYLSTALKAWIIEKILLSNRSSLLLENEVKVLNFDLFSYVFWLLLIALVSNEEWHYFVAKFGC